MKMTGNLFELAEIQLQKREGIIPTNRKYLSLVIDRAIKIRQHLDKQEEKKEKNQFKKVM